MYIFIYIKGGCQLLIILTTVLPCILALKFICHFCWGKHKNGLDIIAVVIRGCPGIQGVLCYNNCSHLAMQVKGKWWIIRGLNCGQSGWPAAFDYFPCQRDEFVLENGNWIDHIAYCGGRNNTCQTPMCHTVANVSITSPGVMTHW